MSTKSFAGQGFYHPFRSSRGPDPVSAGAYRRPYWFEAVQKRLKIEHADHVPLAAHGAVLVNCAAVSLIMQGPALEPDCP
jgi:hypothetical protein